MTPARAHMRGVCFMEGFMQLTMDALMFEHVKGAVLLYCQTDVCLADYKPAN